MKKIAVFAASLWLSIGAALAQSSPNLTFGFVPTPAQWNSYFQSKTDWPGAAAILVSGGTMTGPLITVASNTVNAGFSIPPGVAPTSPNNGNMWTTAAGLFVQVNGSTVGPLLASTTFGNATNSSKGLAQCDGTTITCSSGVITAVGAVATSIGVGTTTIATGTVGDILYNNAGTLGNLPVTGTAGNVVLSTSPTIASPILTGTATIAAANVTALSVGGSLMTFPGSAATIARNDSAQTFTGIQTFSTPIAATSIATMTSTVGGGVPTPPNVSTQFLNGQGAFAIPAGGGSVDNILSNVQWQQTTGLVPIVKQNSAGTASQTPASCSSFTTSTVTPTFTCSNTQQIKVGDIIVVATGPSFTADAYDAFWGFSGLGYGSCNAGAVQCQPTAGTTTSCTVNTNTCYLMGARVTAVVANTSITVTGYIGGISPASSSPVDLFPIVRGDTGTSTLGPDGWTKTSTLACAPDDFAANAYPGSIRTLVCRKGITGQEILEWNVPSNQIARYQGQPLSCGAVVNQTVQGGSNTWNLHIDDSSGSSASPNGTGTGAGGYQFEPVTRTIAQSATSVAFYFNFTGNSGDVFHIALPTCGFVPAIVQSQLHANSNERIKSNGHCNPPILTPWKIEFITGATLAAGLYGWQGIDLQAISFDCYDKSLGGVWAKIEYTSSAVTSMILTGTNINQLNFGPQAGTIVTGVTTVGGPSILELYHDGTFLVMSNTGTYAPTALTFDFWSGETSQPSSIN